MSGSARGGILWLSAALALFGQAGAPAISGISNSASGAPAATGGSWITIYGGNLASGARPWKASDFSGSALPTALDGVSVTIAGKPASISYISPTQINAQAPTGVPTGVLEVEVNNGSGSAKGSITLQDYAPALFTFQQKYPAALHNSDGVYVAPAGYFGGSVASRAAMPGEVLQIYGSGFGPTSPVVEAGQMTSGPSPLADLSKLRVTIGGAAATVQYAGLVFPGQYQLNVVVPKLAAGEHAIAASINGASTQAGLVLPVGAVAAVAPLTITVSPSGKTIRCGATLAFSSTVTGSTDQTVTWQVNGIAGGRAELGTISPSGLYTAPLMLPATGAVMITAVSHADASAKASVTLNLQNPVPAITSLTPDTLAPGAVELTVNGSGFAAGATVHAAGVSLKTTFVSTTKLVATGTLAMPVGRLAAVKVSNPNPGSATSAVRAIPVRPEVEKMPYAAAVRFLQMATWGPTPDSVAELQTMGPEAWLAAQFAKPATQWPDPNTATEGDARLQAAFWTTALTGDSQLRQRAAFALSHILVVSAARETQFQQMVSYLRVLSDDAFSSYRDLLTAISLSPAMGDYLDMVNNDKANPTSGTVANENYARELMQLFTVGLSQLDPQGSPVTVNGAEVPEYDQSTVAELAKVMTGWTYGQTPGYNSLWKNQAYYFGPMAAFAAHHDTTAKQINLPIPCIIGAGGSPDADLNAALDCIFRQANVAPFVSYRLIQRFVMSDPTPGYVGRVATVFRNTGGNLQSVLTAVLTDQEAQIQSSGKLVEPVLYATGLLRALNAKITSTNSLTGQATAMGQTPLAPPSVFSYFSPEYRVPGLASHPVAPEFQVVNASTAMARANFAYRVATGGISGVSLDAANLQDLATNPPDLVEALNQALFRGEMEPDVRAALLTAAESSTNMATRVRSTLYAAAASPQYQVQR